MNGLLAKDDMPQQGQMPPQQMQEQMPQQQAAGPISQRIAGDKVSQQILASIQEQLQGMEHVIMQKLNDGKGDIELEIAETAGNIMRMGTEQAGQELPPETIENVAMQVLRMLINMASDSGLIKQDQARQLAQRALIMAKYIYANGPGSVE